MTYSYEVEVTDEHREMFVRSFLRYMEGVGFAHMSIGGRLGAYASHEFRRDEGLISLTLLAEGQSRFRLVLQSETVPVLPLALDAMTEGLADFLVPFLEALPPELSQNALISLIQRLRDAFSKAPGEEG
jgi:hypothetical protein